MKISMRTRVMLVMLPIAIIPIVIVASFSAIRLFDKLKEQGYVLYSTALTQIATNIDFNYDQYAMGFGDITFMDNFQKIINQPQAKTMNDERNFLESIGEASSITAGNSVTRFVSAKFKGAFYIVEIDKKSLFYNTSVLSHRLSLTDYVIDFEKLINDRFFLDVTKSKTEARTNYGKPPEGIVKGFEADKITMFLYPYYREDEEECKKIMIAFADKNYIFDMYRDIESIKYGTLYAMDRYGNVITANHPNENDDFYDYDSDLGRYVQGDLPAYYKEEQVGISDYRLLNTDSSILEIPRVKDVFENIKEYSYEGKVIRTVAHKGVNYLFLAKHAPKSEVTLFYFLPLPYLYKTIYAIVLWILVISGVIILLVIGLSYYISLKLNHPISKLFDASELMASGNYETQVETTGFFGEFTTLGSSFNIMADTIREYSNNMEGLVKERTEELRKTMDELQKANDENKRELMIAQKIQATLIPKVFPDFSHVDFSGMYLPMEALGGDLYDVHKISETQIGILILDVCGHGVPAALITTMAKISFSANARKFDKTDEILNAVNNEICEAIQGSGDYLTAFYCIIDIERKEIQYTNAAHNDIYLVSKDLEIKMFEQTGPVVGVVPNVPYGVVSEKVKSGDRLVLYTDGVIEARRADNTLYESDRLTQVIKEKMNLSPKEFIQFLYDDILTFKGDTPSDDDIAILIADIV